MPTLRFAPDYFSKLFKREQGLTPELYLKRVRLEQAKQTLGQTELSVDVIAKLCGFSSRHYFHRTFKSELNLTPAEFRRRELAARRKSGRRIRRAERRAG